MKTRPNYLSWVHITVHFPLFIVTLCPYDAKEPPRVERRVRPNVDGAHKMPRCFKASSVTVLAVVPLLSTLAANTQSVFPCST